MLYPLEIIEIRYTTFEKRALGKQSSKCVKAHMRYEPDLKLEQSVHELGPSPSSTIYYEMWICTQNCSSNNTQHTLLNVFARKLDKTH